MITKALSVFLTLLIVSLNAVASAPACSNLFITDTEFLNQQISRRHPDLKFVVENPDQFVATMRQRFDEAKAKNPAEPYQFDYSEIGMPLVKDISSDLTKWTSELRELQTTEPKNKKEISDLLEYSTALSQEAAAYASKSSITYKQTIEFAFFYTRMRGLLEARKQTSLLRFYLFLDRTILNGYHPKSAAEELKLYKERKFSVFPGKGLSPGLREAANPFAKALFNNDKLETIWIPSNASLGQSILLRLLSRNINLVGVTNEPLLADGILRPSGDFWIHDIRHESVKYFLFNQYKLNHQLSPEQAHKLSLKIDQWLVEFNSAVAQVTDKELREAIKLLNFSYHHDRGFPLIPSVYLTPNKQVIYTSVLYFMQKTAGEQVKFSDPVRNLKKADAWLKEFWLKRVDDEKNFINSLTSQQN